ncbi:MAG: DUF1178 family protein [Pseudomonadota bacterium]|nr:DUF1178 family protein [Pseudomonadota bacterium]
MIVYQLACGRGHFFEGWFASSEACDRQSAEGRLECPACSSAEVRKLPAAPYVKGSTDGAPDGAAQALLRQKVAAELRKHLLANTDDVGRDFAEVARRIHYQEEAARNIRGQVTVRQAVELHDEGIEAYAIGPGILPSEEMH